MNSQIHEAALTAAAATGPNPPPLDRLRAAAEYALGRAGADQLILFGSAARGEFGPQSDFDFIAVTSAAARREEGPEEWEHPSTGDGIDVLFADAGTIEAKRRTVGTVYCEAMSQGRTVSDGPTAKLVTTELDPGYEAPKMPKEEYLDLSEAPKYAKQARGFMRAARDAIDNPEEDGHDWPNICFFLQRAAEKALKAVHIAHGAPVTYVHYMRQAWEKAEFLGERFDLEKKDKLLNEMTLYAGKKAYGTPSGWDPAEIATKFRPIAQGLVDHATRRVPELLAEHNRRLQAGQTEEAAMRPTTKAFRESKAPAGSDQAKHRGRRR